MHFISFSLNEHYAQRCQDFISFFQLLCSLRLYLKDGSNAAWMSSLLSPSAEWIVTFTQGWESPAALHLDVNSWAHRRGTEKQRLSRLLANRWKWVRIQTPQVDSCFCEITIRGSLRFVYTDLLSLFACLMIFLPLTVRICLHISSLFFTNKDFDCEVSLTLFPLTAGRWLTCWPWRVPADAHAANS